ncbi:hypothetical protein HK101_000800, partial [Irineochytrium annulatum]
LGAGGEGAAREGLATSLEVLRGIAAVNDRGSAMHDMLVRLVRDCGIEGLEDEVAERGNLFEK